MMTCDRFPECLCPDCGYHRHRFGGGNDGYLTHSEMYHILLRLRARNCRVLDGCPVAPGEQLEGRVCDDPQ